MVTVLIGTKVLQAIQFQCFIGSIICVLKTVVFRVAIVSFCHVFAVEEGDY